MSLGHLSTIQGLQGDLDSLRAHHSHLTRLFTKLVGHNTNTRIWLSDSLCLLRIKHWSSKNTSALLASSQVCCLDSVILDVWKVITRSNAGGMFKLEGKAMVWCMGMSGSGRCLPGCPWLSDKGSRCAYVDARLVPQRHDNVVRGGHFRLFWA